MSGRTECVEACFLCHTPGTLLYPRVRDGLYGHAGEFGELICPTCGLIWLSPRPIREDMAGFYGRYYTHAPAADPGQSDGQPRLLGGLRDAVRAMILCGYYGYAQVHTRHRLCGLGRLLGRFRWLRLRAANELKELIPPYVKGGLLLDIGCGRGDFLCAMRSLGWNVLGVESDPHAVAVARRRGLDVRTGLFEEVDLPSQTADHITLNHVIEHVYDPRAVLEKCYRVLRPGGTLVLYAPNAQSHGHKRFKGHWLPLDPPRHVYTYSSANMRALLAGCGFSRIRLWTSSRQAPGVFDASVMLQGGVVMGTHSAPPQKGRGWFSLRERISCACGLATGEELAASAATPTAAGRHV